MTQSLYPAGIARGWRVLDGRLSMPSEVFDVIVVGSGAGGATAAEVLATRGLRVLIIEEGGLRDAGDFRNDELKAYAQLYQEGALRTTEDGGISILQGRTVGGSTTVNWTTSFRTPDSTLAHWHDQHALSEATPAHLAPFFERIEKKLGIAPWVAAPNENNAVIQRGCEALGWHWEAMQRNVRGCWNLGYCGTGCPTNAKQSMLVTSIPNALEHGATLLHHTRALRLEWSGTQVSGVVCQPMKTSLDASEGSSKTIRARHIVLSGGAIQSPAVLLRSRVPDPFQTLGKRTYLHPVCMNMAFFDQPIDGFYGAPQSIYSDEFNAIPSTGYGFKIEVAPMQPSIVSALMGSYGAEHTERMRQLPQANLMLALLRDGFASDDPGGTVKLRKNGDPVLNYPLRAALWNTVRTACERMADIQFAAGARTVMPVHALGQPCESPAAFREHLATLPMRIFDMRLSSAHVMGGCRMHPRPEHGVVTPKGRHHQLENLSVFDGSIFPSSIGANPQLSIYAWALKLSEELAETLAPSVSPV